MFTVECPECKVTYQVDERRVPANGLRMRCPKCSAAFVVQKPDADAPQTPPAAVPSTNVVAAGVPKTAPEIKAVPEISALPAPKATAAIPTKPARPDAPSPVGTQLEKKPAPPVRSPLKDAAPPRTKPAVPSTVGKEPVREGTSTQQVAHKSPGVSTAAIHAPPDPKSASGQARVEPGARAAIADDPLLPQAVPSRSHAIPAATKRGAQMLPPTRTDDGLQDVDLPVLVDPLRARSAAKSVSTGSERFEPDLPASRDGVAMDSYLPAALGATKQARPGSPVIAAPAVTAPAISAPAKLSSDDGGVDLPSLVPAKNEARATQRELPRTRADQFELDLPSPVAPVVALPARADLGNSLELGDLEFELPSPMQTHRAGGIPGPSVAPVTERTVGTNHADLPDVAESLPSLAAPLVGLPSVPGKDDTSKRTLTGTTSSPPTAPTPRHRAEIPEIDLGLDFEAGAEAMLGGFDTHRPSASAPNAASLPPALGGGASGSSRDLIDFGEDLESSLLPSAGAPVAPKSTRSEGIGGTGYGEVRLEPMVGEVSVEAESPYSRRSLTGDALEFGAVPEAATPASGSDAPAGSATVGTNAAAATAVGYDKAARAAERADRPSVSRSKKFRILSLAAVAAIAIAGGSLSLVPDLGPFGINWISDQIHRKDNDALVSRQIETCQKILAADDFSGVNRGLEELRQAQREHERLRELKAYYAYFAYMVELRHGHQSQERARAKVVLGELANRDDLKYVGIANAVRAAVEGNLAKARHTIAAYSARDARSADAALVSAEIAMLERRYPEAVQTWQQVERLESSPRASFGSARANHALGQYDAARSDAEKTIQRNPGHVGARLILARSALEKGSSELAQRYISEALNLVSQQSLADFVSAKTLSGDLHLMGSRISLAEAAYQEALAKDPRSSAALRGLGETLYRAGRYAESLARFEAGLQADPDDVLVAVGVAKAQLALERVREAATVLARLRQSNPKHYAVNYWYGRTEEAAGDREQAERAYAMAIDVGGTDPLVVDAYVAMALLKNQQGRREEAQKVLLTAQQKLPRLPKIFDAIGQLALSEGRYASAIDQFKQALALNPTDLGVKFRLGTALRKNREFDAAAKAFDEVSSVDQDYPGLALERGQLYESSGRSEEALRAFELALAKAPTDPDLMLRVGCGKVAAGRSQQAEQLLKKVLEQRPTSAETHHCLGRAQLLDGSNLATALRTLERAVELDPHRAEYHLYVGWAANEAGRVAVAEQALRKALELDQGLGDAYWQRGILRYRQGAVKDAVIDLTRALELMPGRYEAHAALADAYFDLGLEPKALEQWRLATVAQPDNATWRFRYGKLLQAARRDNEARQELEAALELAAKLPTVPRWAWEAHHLLARAIGSQPAAVKHWEAFLEFAPRDNAYRDEAKQILSKLGKPWTRD